MSARLEYFFDYVSPFSYLADSQLPGLIERTGAELVYRPVLLGGIMQAAGNSPPFTVPNKGAWVARDSQRWAQRYGVPLNPNPHFPFKTVRPMRAAIALLDEPGFADFHRAAFAAVWRDGLDLGDEAVLREVLGKAGCDADAVITACGDPAVKEGLQQNTAEAVERGAFGAPTFLVGDELFFGNDRLDFVEEALAG